MDSYGSTSNITTNTQHGGAVIVMLTFVISLYAAVKTIGTSISAIIPTIAAVGQSLVSIWQSVSRTLDPGSIPIDYSPA